VPAGPLAAKTSLRERASNRFDDAGAAGVAIAMEDMAMNDDLVPEARSCESLRLIKAFLRLADPGRRGRVLDLAEHLAEAAGGRDGRVDLCRDRGIIRGTSSSPWPNRMKPTPSPGASRDET
jgi:hypothetical protein